MKRSQGFSFYFFKHHSSRERMPQTRNLTKIVLILSYHFFRFSIPIFESKGDGQEVCRNYLPVFTGNYLVLGRPCFFAEFVAQERRNTFPVTLFMGFFVLGKNTLSLALSTCLHSRMSVRL